MNVVRKEIWIKIIQGLCAEVDMIENECIAISAMYSRLKAITGEASPEMAKQIEKRLEKIKTYSLALQDYRKGIMEQIGRIDRRAVNG